MLKSLTCALLSLTAFHVFGAEVDQFTRRDEPLEDISSLINTKANQTIVESISKLNNENSGCDETALYSELRLHFGNHIKGDFTKFIIDSSEVPKRHIDIKDSIYRDWKISNGFILAAPVLKKAGTALSDLVKVGDLVVGTDKFEHLFGRGFSYFTNKYLDGNSIEDTLDRGASQEKFEYGGIFAETGVFSYGDLAANFNGMRFWNHVLLKEDDILGADKNLGPYISCVDKKWIQTSEIDFRNYFDKSVDESVNCSKFSLIDSAEKYRKQVAALGLKCGATIEEKIEFEAKYGRFNDWIINDNGNIAVKYFGGNSDK